MKLLNINDAAEWASSYLINQFGINKSVSSANISYLVQYGKVKKYIIDKNVMVNIDDLENYYLNYHGSREDKWKDKLGDDIMWELSFENLSEKETTKHVHRLHPYKGKFIPQLVEYFIDTKTDNFKTEVFFNEGDIIIDPFLGSGTTIVQAKEQGIHGIGIDISEFNCMISKSKVQKYDIKYLEITINNILQRVKQIQNESNIINFENELKDELTKFNAEYFPSPDYKFQVSHKIINEKDYAEKKSNEFLEIYTGLVEKHKIMLQNYYENSFLDKWYISSIRNEIEQIKNIIDEENNFEVKRLLQVILSKTIRSCRATTHSDLATLKEPQLTTYYCHKHYKICRPLFSIISKFKQYSNDAIKRIKEYSEIKTNAHTSVLNGDSTSIDIFNCVKNDNLEFYNLLIDKKIKGMFTSPPYVGQIDYHEQHAYAYELFNIERKDDLEIGKMANGKGKKAQEDYKIGISNVLINCSKYMSDDFNIFIVANDKLNLYKDIAEMSNMKIVNKFDRPVLNRTERDKNPYAETIFHLVKNK